MEKVIKRLAWASDVHFNFFGGGAAGFCWLVEQARPDALVITGDISEGDSIEMDLRMLDEGLDIPIYFVLGNHDYYRSSIRIVRDKVLTLCQASKHLHYLSGIDGLSLSPEIAICGHDGWADGRLGDYERSTVMLNDYLRIFELSGLDKFERLRRLNALGDEAATHFKTCLPKLFDKHRLVILATHVPPFKEAAWHEGGQSDDNFLPHFACGAVGDVLIEVMGRFPDNELLVLCGHTHSSGIVHPMANMTVRTAGAVYGYPELAEVFNLLGTMKILDNTQADE